MTRVGPRRVLAFTLPVLGGTRFVWGLAVPAGATGSATALGFAVFTAPLALAFTFVVAALLAVVILLQRAVLCSTERQLVPGQKRPGPLQWQATDLQDVVCQQV